MGLCLVRRNWNGTDLYPAGKKIMWREKIADTFSALKRCAS